MNFRKAWKAMLSGKKVKRPFWDGYWAWEAGTIMIHERDGNVMDIRSTQHVAYTFDNIASKDWVIVKEEEEEKAQLSDESTTSDEENATSVEIDVITNIELIMPAPTEHDPMRDLKDRFNAELNSLKVMLDCDNFSGMAQLIERLEQLRIKMAGLAAMK